MADAGPRPPTPQGGAGGSMHIGSGGTDQGQGGSDVGAGGSEVGQAGTGGTGAGTGGTDQGQAGTDQGGTGGTDGEPTPVCDYQGGTCDGLLYKECDVGEYFETACEHNCDPNRGGCYGECMTGDVRCTDGAAQACLEGVWTGIQQCAFQCVNGACEGACTPGAVVCDGLATVTCGSDFHYGSPSACPTDPNGTTSCNDGECDLQPIACSAGTADCDSNWSCETDLSSLSSCGACGNVCPTRANATRTCDGTCGFTCNAGFEDCDGNAANGCELDTRADALNCGACGNSCYGSSCTAGECQFAFDVVSDFTGETFTSNIRELALGPTHVYWLTESELRRAPKAGGDYETLASVVPGATVKGLAVESGKVAWVALDGIYVMAEAGGTPTRLVQTPTSAPIRGIAAANGKLYWSDTRFAQGANCRDSNFSNESAFRSCNSNKVTTFFAYDLATADVTDWAVQSGEWSPPLGVVGNEMFVAEYEPIFVNFHAEYNIRILARNATTGLISRVVADAVAVPSDSGLVYGARIQLEGAAFTANSLVYSAQFVRGNATVWGVVSGPVTGGADPRTTNTFLAPILTSTLSLDETSAFYSDASGVYSVSLEGGAAHPFFDNDTDTGMPVAVDDTYIYFSAYATNGEQAVLRAPK